MNRNIYLNNEYFINNPTWGVEDSLWKANLIKSTIDHLNLSPKNIAEIGCGAGEILNQLHQMLPGDVHYSGFEISPKAHELCQSRRQDRLDFYLGDIPKDDSFDLLLALDVFEHVDNYLEFLRDIRSKASIKIFHIPLDISVRSVAMTTPILHARDTVGHLHYFSKETALRTLTDCGYEVIDWLYTSGPYNRPPRMKLSATSAWIAGPLRRALFRWFPDYWVRLLGGSMLVVAK